MSDAAVTIVLDSTDDAAVTIVLDSTDDAIEIVFDGFYGPVLGTTPIGPWLFMPYFVTP